MQPRKSRQPVSTILPLAKSSTVHTGTCSRIVMAANFFWVKLEFGSRTLTRCRSSDVMLMRRGEVPTTLCTMTVSGSLVVSSCLRWNSSTQCTSETDATRASVKRSPLLRRRMLGEGREV